MTTNSNISDEQRMRIEKAEAGMNEVVKAQGGYIFMNQFYRLLNGESVDEVLRDPHGLPKYEYVEDPLYFK
jgi:hypothetical protein